MESSRRTPGADGDGRTEHGYKAGLPDHHDPTSQVGGAPRALSALTLRAILAAFGVLACTALAVVLATSEAPVALVVLMALLGLVAAVDLVIVLRRKRRGEPG